MRMRMRRWKMGMMTIKIIQAQGNIILNFAISRVGIRLLMVVENDWLAVWMDMVTEAKRREIWWGWWGYSGASKEADVTYAGGLNLNGCCVYGKCLRLIFVRVLVYDGMNDRRRRMEVGGGVKTWWCVSYLIVGTCLAWWRGVAYLPMLRLSGTEWIDWFDE